MNKTIEQMLLGLQSGKTTSETLVQEVQKAFEADNKTAKPLNAFLELYDDVLQLAKSADELWAKARTEGADAVKKLLAEKPLLGLPFAVKDNISVKGKKFTCGSKILESYVAPYDAMVIQRLKNAGAIPVGRCNQDEFAMGSSTEYSAYGPTRNPVNRDCVAGGSSGGSAAVVAAGMVPFALGTETGGSVRLPASYCGVYGLKPSYGVLSRWGAAAFGSSLDQVGLFGRTPADIALPLSVMAGADIQDSTSCDLPEVNQLRSVQPLSADAFKKLKVAIPRQFLESKGMDAEVKAVFDKTRAWFESKGASITVVDIPVLDASIASYYVIALSEAASNLNRFDGIRFGARKDPGEGFDELYVQTRSEGFGAEVKRRIIIGNYVLSENFSGDCYKKAMNVRARIQREIKELYTTYDCVLCPVCPTPAFKLGQKTDDPMAMYLSDMFTVFVNLSRTAAVSVPAGRTAAGLPVGMQFAGPMLSESRLLSLCQNWEQDHPGCGGAK